MNEPMLKTEPAAISSAEFFKRSRARLRFEVPPPEDFARALTALLDGGALQKGDFAEYDVYDDGTESPFGADVLVHAANDNGHNFLVSVLEE